MAANTSRLKTFAQATRSKLISLITARLDYLLSADNAETRGWAPQIAKLREAIERKGKREVIEEVAYTWFNRIMALRYMDANGFNSPMVVSIAEGQTRPQILDEGMAGSFDEDLNLSDEDKLLTGPALYRKLLVATCNNLNASMPFLFEHITDYTEILLPDDLLSAQSFVTDIRNGMTDEDCQDVEVVGWLYQFYINDRKDEAEKNKSRRGGLKSDEQAAATQLFTPHWIVRYMVENSLGRIWMTLHPDSKLVEEMPYYLAPVNGQTDQIPEDIKSVADIRFLDPCMGSGHVLVYAFDLLTKMYEEEGFPTKKIPGLIFENNLYGMDIDRRCYQLASFALTMKARAYYSRFLRRPVQPKVLALQPIDRQTIETAGAWPAKSLVWQMENLDTIGSLLKITPEEAASIKVDGGVFGEQQRLMKEQAEYLSGSYHCVVTNPPYLGKGIGALLKQYMESNFPNSKADTMAAFMERCFQLSGTNGKCGMINMQAWMFIPTYEALRNQILESYTLDSLLLLGPRAFEELSGEVVQSVSFIFSINDEDKLGYFYRLTNGNSVEKKNAYLLHKTYFIKPKSLFKKMPSQRFVFWGTEQFNQILEGSTLEKVSDSRCGMATGDNAKYSRFWCELNVASIGFNLSREEIETDTHKWYPYAKAGTFRRWYGNITECVFWENNGEVLRTTLHPSGSRIWAHNFNLDKIFLPHISWSDFVTTGNMSFRYFTQGFLFDASSNSAFPFKDEDTNYILGLTNTKIIQMIKPMYNPGQHFTAGNFLDIPYTRGEEDQINSLVSINITISKQDWDAHETSWDFEESPLLIAKKDCSKNVADLDMLDEEERKEIMKEVPDVYDGRLISNCVNAYKSKWSRMFHQLHQNEEELNRKFIEIYGLQDELTPDVPLDEVTILQKGEINWEAGRPRPATPSASSQMANHFLDPDEQLTVHGHKLPHWNQHDKYMFITFRLGDSLPMNKLKELESARKKWLESHPEPWNESTEKENHSLFSQKIDEWLDKGAGSCILSDPKAAAIVQQTLIHDDGKKYELADYVIMPNHVHILVRLFDEVTIESVMQEWKSVSSHILRKAFGQEWCGWMENYYDRHIRNEAHFDNVERYIYKNWKASGEKAVYVGSWGRCGSRCAERGRSGSQLPWQDDVIIKQFISYLVGCFMGRYSVDRPGLIIANQGQKPSDLDLPQSTIEIDDDGIIPIIQEPDFFADDMTVRVEEAVEILFGKESKAENLRYIREAIGMPLRDYFFKEYYKDHLGMYSVKGAKRPIYWLFSSKMGDKKKKGAFKALIYMHRMEADTLSKLHADYVHPYIEKLEREFGDNEKELEREDLPTKKRNELLKLSETLRGKIREVKDFETELVKMASARPTFDLDDGVATNYPRFYPLVEPIKGLDAKDD